MKTLNDFAAEIEAAIANQDAQTLAELSREIRCILWANRRAARVLANRADNAARQIAPHAQRLPRFDGITSGGVFYPPVK